MKNPEIPLRKFKKFKKKLNIEDLIFETKKYMYHFQELKKIKSFGKTICNGKITSKNVES